MYNKLYHQIMSGTVLTDDTNSEGSSSYFSGCGTQEIVEKLTYGYKIAKYIIDTSHNFFSGTDARYPIGFVCLNNISTGRIINIFLNFSSDFVGNPSVYLKYRRVHPLIAMFSQKLGDFAAKPQLQFSYCESFRSREVAAALNEFVEAVRKEAREVKFKNQMIAYEKGEKKNIREAQKYLNALYEAYSKLLLVRIHLGYKYKEFGLNSDGMWNDTDKIREQFRKLLKRVHSKQSHLLGYIWKLEFGECKLWHWHVIFIFNGHERSSDNYICNSIGKAWKEITHNEGLYVNCNMIKVKCEERATGEINTRDPDARRRVNEHVIEFLLKGYHVANSVNRKNLRTFGKGGLPECAKIMRLDVESLEVEP